MADIILQTQIYIDGEIKTSGETISLPHGEAAAMVARGEAQWVTPPPPLADDRHVMRSEFGDVPFAAAGGTVPRSAADRAFKKSPQDFGAIGDGVADDTAAFISLKNWIKDRILTDLVGDANKTVYGTVELPPGAYLITQPQAIWDDTFTTRALGLTIEGTGAGAEIKYRPASSGPLIKNNDSLLLLTFRGIRFDCDDADSDFYETISSGGAQDVLHNRCYWTGTWRYGVNLSGGTDTNSEMQWQNCGVYGTFTWFLHGTTSDQNLNYWFNQCKMWGSGGWIRMTKGGNIRITACDVSGYQPAAEQYIFSLEGSDHAGGACSFYCNCRFELKNTNAKVMYCEWNYGNITWVGCDESSQSAIVSSFETHRYSTKFSDSGPSVLFHNCNLMGHHTYEYAVASWAQQHRHVYIGCQILQKSTLTQFVQWSGEFNYGGRAVAKFVGCTIRDNYAFEQTDCDIGWASASVGVTSTKVLSIKNPGGVSPFSEQEVSLKLPLGSVITRARMFLPAGAFGVSGAYDFSIKTIEGSPTTIVSASGADMSAGFNVDAAQFFVCDSDFKRQLILKDNANTDKYSTEALFIVEYIG